MSLLFGLLAALVKRRRKAGGHWAWTAIWLLTMLLKRLNKVAKPEVIRYRVKPGDQIQISSQELGTDR